MWKLSILFIFGQVVRLNADFLLNEAKKYDYIGELHHFETSDGFILGLHRIFNSSFASKPKETVLFAHGLFANGVEFGLGGRYSLIHLLADQGFDVWLYNARANKVSSGHRYFTNDQAAYWNWSWHEIGAIDIPQSIDYVLRTTNSTKLHYVGHSQGGTVFGVMLGIHPEYNEKIKSAFMIAPAIFIPSSFSLLRVLAPPPILKPIRETLFSMNLYGVSFQSELLQQVLSIMRKVLSTWTINFILSLIAGPTSSNDNREIYEIFFKHAGDSCSFKQLYHFGQILDTGNFAMYDYEDQNLRVYGSRTPPDYNLSHIQVPLAVAHSGKDAFVTANDIDRLFEVLGKHVVDRFFYKNWNHIEFIYPKNVINETFPKMFQFFKKFK